MPVQKPITTTTMDQPTTQRASRLRCAVEQNANVEGTFLKKKKGRKREE